MLTPWGREAALGHKNSPSALFPAENEDASSRMRHDGGWCPAHEERGGARLLHFQTGSYFAWQILSLSVSNVQRASTSLAIAERCERASQAATNDSRMQPRFRAGEMRANQPIVLCMQLPSA